MTGVVLDSGALIAVERGDRTMSVLLAEARRAKAPIIVPAGCIAQVWRSPARQARIAVLLRQQNVEIIALDDQDARRIGVLLAAIGAHDVVDGHVAVCAHRARRPVLTSDPDDISRLGPELVVRRI